MNHAERAQAPEERMFPLLTPGKSYFQVKIAPWRPGRFSASCHGQSGQGGPVAARLRLAMGMIAAASAATMLRQEDAGTPSAATMG
jgi:hypothetical protein